MNPRREVLEPSEIRAVTETRRVNICPVLVCCYSGIMNDTRDDHGTLHCGVQGLNECQYQHQAVANGAQDRSVWPVVTPANITHHDLT